jgi:hypothetical protein
MNDDIFQIIFQKMELNKCHIASKTCKKWNIILNKKTEQYLYIKYIEKFEQTLFEYMSYKSYTDYCCLDNTENEIFLQKINKLFEQRNKQKTKNFLKHIKILIKPHIKKHIKKNDIGSMEDEIYININAINNIVILNKFKKMC